MQVESVASRVVHEGSQERRSAERFRLPGGLVRIQCRPFEVHGARAHIEPRGLSAWLGLRRNRCCDVANISRGGIAIDSARPFRQGQRVVLRLSLPSMAEPLQLSGQVRWQRAEYDGVSYRVGICFDPFGDGPDMNPRAALAALRALEVEHGS